MNVYTAQKMRDFDSIAIEQYHVPSIVLMENAALRVVEFLEAKFAPLADKYVAVLCGKGNNGGDGLAVARHLANTGARVTVILACSPDDFKGDALINYNILTQAGGSQGSIEKIPILELRASEEGVIAIDTETEAEVDPGAKRSPDITIDALLGTGFKGAIHDERITRALELRNEGEINVAVDLPSGLNADTGESASHAHLSADYTITFAGPKRGLLTRDGLQSCGEIWVGDVGNLREAFTSPANYYNDEAGIRRRSATGVTCLTRSWARYDAPHRTLDAHKGTAGRVLICGGSIGLSGAPAIATRAALKSGAGLCTAALSAPVLQTLSARESEPTGHALPADEMGRLKPEAAEELATIWKSMNVVAIGPGLSREAGPLEFTRRVVRTCPHPLVLDADALYALPAIADEVKSRQAPTILTPHPGEMGELMSMKTEEVQKDRFGVVLACAQKYNAIVVLKGARTLIAHPDGRIWVNLTGNPGMATGGSGDALTGTIAGLLAQTRYKPLPGSAPAEKSEVYGWQLQESLEATTLGVYIHGLAGDLAYEKLGNGLIAGDIVEHLPAALLELDKPGTPPINARLRKLE